MVVDKQLSQEAAKAFTSPAWRVRFFGMSLTDYGDFQTDFVKQVEQAGTRERLPEEAKSLLDQAKESFKLAQKMGYFPPYTQDEALAVMRKLKPQPENQEEEFDITF